MSQPETNRAPQARIPHGFAIRTPADIEALEGIPLDQRLEGLESTYDVLAEAAHRYGESPALLVLDDEDPTKVTGTVSYVELLDRVTRAANAFAALGVGANDTVSFLLPNLRETHVTFWGAEAAGIVNPINWYLEPAQIIEIMNAANTKVLVSCAPERHAEIWSKVEAIRRHVPSLRAIVQVGASGPAHDDLHAFDHLLNEQPGDRLLTELRGGNAAAAYFHTGGTTGAPKIAVQSHANQLADALMAATVLDLGRHDVTLCGLPMFHVNAMVITGIASFMAGASVVLAGSTGYRNKPVVKRFWKIVEATRASVFSAVPSVYASLLNEPVGDANLRSLRYGICGAAPMPIELFRRFEAATGIKILEAYGLTEGTCLSTANPRDGERRVGSIGLRAPYQQMKAALLDDQLEYVRDCRPEEVGSLLIRGPNVFSGYKEDRHNKKLWAAPGWLNTGDLGRQDTEGYFWLAGRQKELIIRGGHNIDPAIIEEAMLRHPAVQMAAAVGKPDAYAGELPIAFVVLKPDAQATTEELLEHARRHVPERAAVPSELFLLPMLPLTAVGKVFKPQLRFLAIQMVLERTAREVCGPKAHIDVRVGPDSKHGTAAVVRVSEIPSTERDPAEASLRSRLGAFNIACSYEWIE